MQHLLNVSKRSYGTANSDSGEDDRRKVSNVFEGENLQARIALSSAASETQCKLKFLDNAALGHL